MKKMKNNFDFVAKASKFVHTWFQEGFNVFTFQFVNGHSITGIIWTQIYNAEVPEMIVTLRSLQNIEETASFDMGDVEYIKVIV
jgi:hypothetical protein